MSNIFKHLYLIFILFPVAVIYGIIIAIITLVEHIIEKSIIKWK
jgi:hypothetical protein